MLTRFGRQTQTVEARLNCVQSILRIPMHCLRMDCDGEKEHDVPDIALNVSDGNIVLQASLSVPPAGRAREGLVLLHGASTPSRDFFLYRHLAELLPEYGIAVLRYDRRPSTKDVPFALQSGDALAALRLLRSQLSLADAPIGLWGFSQGAWAAVVAAAHSDEVAFLVLVSSAGVSPAVQMRYGTARQLRQSGYGDEPLKELAELRSTFEGYLRGRQERGAAQAAVDRYATRPWFPLVHVPRTLPEPGSWEDMDFDPEPVFAQVRCPVLLFYGEDDEWVPIDDCIAAWRRAAASAGNEDVTIVRLPGTLHLPTLSRGDTIAFISPEYTDCLTTWLKKRFRAA